MKQIFLSKLNKRKVNRFTKKAIALITSIAVLLVSLPYVDMSSFFDDIPFLHVHAASPLHQVLTYNDLTDFVTYSINYSTHSDEYCEDEITLALNKGAINTFPSGYIPLGTEDHPFNGKIYINQTYGNSWWFETEKPLFDYIADSAEINYYDQAHNNEAIQIELRRKENSLITPLFANHVTEGGNTKSTWKIKSGLQQQSSDSGYNYLVCNYSGLIGSMDQNASVNIEYDNSAIHGDNRSDVISSNDVVDVGLICGSMNSGSKIKITLTGANTGCYVTSSAGHAGGLIGSMSSGAELEINSTYTPSTSRIITASNGYAGGIVGYNNGGKVTFSTVSTETEIRGTITGKDGAGGIFGYYTNAKSNNVSQNDTFDLRNYDVNCTVKATAAGGVAGVVNGTANITIDGSETGANEITVTGDTVTEFGGIFGKYQTSALANALDVNTVTVNTSASFTGTSYYGGVAGIISGTSAAYIKSNSFTHKSSAGFNVATAFGGVVGNAGNRGSMLDVGTVTIETGVVAGTAANGTAYKGGGIVGVLTDGVLRLSGTTNLSKAPCTPATPKTSDAAEYKLSGQLVGVRTNSLVYATGNGNSGDWIFNRSTTQVNADDIGTWGSVIRPDGTNLTLANLESKDGVNTGVLDFHTTNHSVTVKAPVTTNMSSAADYTSTALNMQLNSGDKGALKFADSTNTKSALLGTNLSFSGTINLSGTGNIGLMRDDYKDSVDEIGAYTKTISGGTVNLAIGERYGSPGAGIGRGDIIAHRNNGLITRTDTGAEVNGITIGGTINVNATIDGTHVGGAVSDAKKGITLTSVTAQETINFNKISGSNHIVGGMVADVTGGNTSISGGTAKPTITLTGDIGSIPIGGAIGKITNTSKTITASSFTVAAKINSSGASGTDVSCVGFISEISGGSMSLTGVTVNGTEITNCASGDNSHSGGFLGMKWLGSDVSFTVNNGVILSGTNTLSTSAKYAAGLVQYATGHWTVPEKGISITGMSISNATNSLGLIVHDGYSSSDGLYLELTHKDSYYLGTGLTIPNTTYYDELVRSTGSDILSNSNDKAGNGIISITTDGDLIMNGTSCNTYQNKYNTGNLTNSKSRYYYNLTSICAKATKSDGEKLLLWSLNKYAATNINSNFTNSFGTGAITGTFDMEHLSYYPIDVGSAVIIGDATFMFYNQKIESSEGGTGNSDSGVRTTRGASQHFLMHSGVFRNVSSTLTTSGNIHFKGDIGVGTITTGTGESTVITTYSGALIDGTLSGTFTTATDKEIVFEGMTISDSSKYLLINKLSTNSKLTLSGVRTGGGKDFSNADKSSTETKYTAGATVASSLIGNVSGNGIQISFDRMKLDSRTSVGSPADWSAQYGTTKSIFSGATFLNKFDVDNNSTGTYNFLESEDWDNGTHNANVTYGVEIKTSKQYPDKQKKYCVPDGDDSSNYVDPINNPTLLTDVYGFDSGFLPYVKESTAILAGDPPVSQYSTRELKVNVYVEGLTVGCGTYNHPYEIEKGSQLVSVATSINKSSYFPSLRLPKIQGSAYATAISTHWCETPDTTCAEFTHGTGNYTYTEGSKTYTWTEDQVSLYLASAYYLIKKNITIEDTADYPGLGASPTGDTTGKYAFRGVIVGASEDGSVTITNKTKRSEITYTVSNKDYKTSNTMGLISMSNGCVVKDLTIVVDLPTVDSSIKTDIPTNYNYNYSANVGGNAAYGYDEKNPNYGAVINKIMGGDNIIDNVSVSLAEGDCFKIYSGDNDYKSTVGGYVGCVVNGGLIFRNVDDDSLTNFTVKKVGLTGALSGDFTPTSTGTTILNSTTGTLTDEDDVIHIHVNPFVGRVINGYAIRESTTVKENEGTENERIVEEAHYSFSEDGATYSDGETRDNAVEVTMHNTRKNYSIPDIDTTKSFQDDDDSVLTFTKPSGETSYNTITVPNSQALYIMSIIAQSGSGCASSESGKYAYNISYCGDSNNRTYAGTVKANNKATHLAEYCDIGEDTKGDDYNLSQKDQVTTDTSDTSVVLPYIIYKYTSSYTSEATTYYPARTLTKRTFYVNLVGGTTYYLPDSFRGIGFLGSNNLDDNMKIYGFNGNGTTSNPTVIDVNTEYFLNQKDSDPYFRVNIGAEYMVGIGLFNNLRQSSSTGFDRKYESNSKYQITNFTLQGYLSAHHVSSSGADQNANPKDNRDGVSMNTAGFVPTVLINDVTLYNFSNILFKNLHINSYAYAGGFVAYTNNSGVMIYINNCNADGFKVEGSGRIAGFVGSFDTNTNDNSGIHINTGLDILGNDSFTSVMKNTIINNRLSTDVKQNYTAGILGSVYSSVNNSIIPADNGDNARGHLILRNVTIEGGNAETNYIGNKNSPNGSSGGIVGGGSARVNGCLIQNCTVKDIDIYGRHAGGIMGENSNFKTNMNPPSVTSARIIGCTVTGELDENNIPQYSIVALQYAGGVYGATCDSGAKNAKYKSISAGNTDYVEYKTDIDGVYVYGYNICSKNKDNLNESTVKNSFGAGGITGNNDNDRKIQNCKIEKCVIDVGTNATSATNTPSGGLIGRMNSGILYGYNIEVKDCDFQTHQWSNGAATNIQKAYTYTDENNVTHNPVSGMKCGNFVGNGNSKIVNLTAVHSENNPAAVDFNSTSSSSFIIYADYNDVASGNDKGTEMSTLSTLPTDYENVGEGGLKDHFPNVNVSPVVKMGTVTTVENEGTVDEHTIVNDVILTSDGAALYGKVTGTDENDNPVITSTPVIDAIVNESGSNYTTSTSAVKTFIQNALLSSTVDGEPNKISTYKTEMGSLPDGVDDFTVLVINSENRDYSTALINNYIQMATNTNYAFMSKPKWSDKYNINVYPCTYDGSKYVIGATGKTAGLNVEEPGSSDGSYRYYMSNTHADSNQGDYQFSLMDVQFYNPNTSLSEIAYHLYIPVLTKKMLLFEFKSASQQGTDNKYLNFSNYANTLAESLESWYTAYLNFTYGQTEINSMLESGAGLNWNGAKTVLFKYQTDSVSAKLSSDTQLVLCDPNNADKYYYSTLADHRPLTDTDGENDTISFANFKTSVSPGGTDFAPATLNEMLLAQGFTITASVSATASENIYVVTENAAEADVILEDGTMYKYAGVGNQGTHKINISYLDENDVPVPSKTLEENYYLAVRAEGNSVYNYSIRTPATTSGGANKPTLRRSNTDEGNVTNIIMGSLYSQTVTINVKNNNTTASEITSANHRLDVELTSMITLAGTSSDKDYIIGHLANPNISLYQSFIIYLTAKDDDGTRSEIRGTPNVTTNFSLSGNNNSATYNNVPQDGITGTYIQLQHYDMKQYLSKDGTAMITAVTHIDFDEDWKYQAEFPVQDGEQNQIGVNVSAVSNLSYNSEKMRYTNMTKSPTTPSNIYFYIKESDEATLVYNMKSEILDEYDKVGVSSFNYSQQGINPKNFIDSSRDRLPIKTAATYSATKIKRSDFTNAEKIQFKLKLYKKIDDGAEVKYAEVSDLANYIDLTTSDSVFIKVDSGVTADYVNGGKMQKSGNNELSYTADINQSLFTRQEDQRITADIDFTVITGEGFTEFANYRFVLSVDLLKPKEDDVSQYESLTNTSYTRDWVVYTNAKINPDMLTLTEYNGS